MNLLDLGKIGLTDGEIKLYDALLELGECTLTNLAKESGVSQSKVYNVANRLIKKGLVSSVKQDGVIHFSAANPRRIIDFVHAKKDELIREENLAEQMLPFILSKYNNSKKDTSVEVFSGWEGMKTVYWDIGENMKKGDKNYVLGASQGKNSEQADTFFSQYYKGVVEKKGYSVSIIFNEDIRKNKERTKYYSKNENHKVKYLYQDTFTEINFYKDTVLFVMLFSNPLVIRIRNKEAADSFKQFFESMWKAAKK
jgi:sugar-specific transcriptional regulator TrmB